MVNHCTQPPIPRGSMSVPVGSCLLDYLVCVWDALEVGVCELRSEDGPVPVRHGDEGYLRQPPMPVGGPRGDRHVVVPPQVVTAHPLHVDGPAGEDDSLRHRALGGGSTSSGQQPPKIGQGPLASPQPESRRPSHHRGAEDIRIRIGYPLSRVPLLTAFVQDREKGWWRITSASLMVRDE